MEQRSISISKTAHYSLSGNKNSKKLVVAFHGYGQLSRYFIRKFVELETDYLIVVPEGLNYFYTDGFAGRVGASWMTKENRLEEINNYVSYYNVLLESLAEEFGSFEEIILLGFSQGTATASRCMTRGKSDIAKLILWSGLPASEIELEELKEISNHIDLIYVQGKEDALRPEEHYKTEMAKLDTANVRYEEHWYDGGHAIDASFLKKVMA